MPEQLRLMVVAAHPDDETLGFGGVLARYAAEGVATSIVIATRGDRGRYIGHAAGSADHPGPERLVQIRESELAAAAKALGIHDVTLLDYKDQEVDRADVREIVPVIVRHIRRLRPHVVLTFAPDGGYGHPDHIAISQFAGAAIVAAADARFHSEDLLGVPHAVSKFYYLAWDESMWAAYSRIFKRLVSNVDGVERQAVPWPTWTLTTEIDTAAYATVVREAIRCHQSQMPSLQGLPPGDFEPLLARQTFYRVFSLVNGGREVESSLFAGLA